MRFGLGLLQSDQNISQPNLWVSHTFIVFVSTSNTDFDEVIWNMPSSFGNHWARLAKSSLKILLNIGSERPQTVSLTALM